MNSSRTRIITLGACLVFLAGTGSPILAAAAKTGKITEGNRGVVNFERTKTRIDALLTLRLKPTSLPDNLPNPFEMTETAPKPTLETDPKPVPEKLPVSTDDEMLLYYGASLRISGTVRIDNETHLIINQAPYKTGDLFVIKTKDAVAKLRILGIAPGELTLGLNDAVQIIKFKK